MRLLRLLSLLAFHNMVLTEPVARLPDSFFVISRAACLSYLWGLKGMAPGTHASPREGAFQHLNTKLAQMFRHSCKPWSPNAGVDTVMATTGACSLFCFGEVTVKKPVDNNIQCL